MSLNFLAKLQKKTLFEVTGTKLYPAYCVMGACGVWFIVANVTVFANPRNEVAYDCQQRSLSRDIPRTCCAIIVSLLALFLV
jgi:uncharacterized membrane protein SpoIIM required for sporulation